MRVVLVLFLALNSSAIIAANQEKRPTQEEPTVQKESAVPGRDEDRVSETASKEKIENKFIELASEANLIFHGTVIKIEYSFSDDNNYFKGTPLTFVTFELKQLIRGKKDLKLFTVRHTGGPGKISGDFVIPSHVNHYNVGDEEIVFVKDNGYVHDPVIQRVSVLDGSVYLPSGFQIDLDSDGSLGISEKNENERFKKIKIGNAEFSTTMIGFQEMAGSASNAKKEKAKDDLIGNANTNKLKQSISDFKANLKKNLKQKDAISDEIDAEKNKDTRFR